MADKIIYGTGGGAGNAIDACYIGSSAADKVYLGTALVYQASSTILLDEFNGFSGLDGTSPDTIDNTSGRVWDNINVGAGCYNRINGIMANSFADTGTGCSIINVNQNTWTATAKTFVTSNTDDLITVNTHVTHGIVVNADASTGAFERIGVGSSSSIFYQRWNGSSYEVSTGIAAISVAKGDELDWVITKTSASSVDYSITVNGGTVYTGTQALTYDTTFSGVYIRNVHETTNGGSASTGTRFNWFQVDP